jgi:hypothetical protein
VHWTTVGASVNIVFGLLGLLARELKRRCDIGVQLRI